MGYWRNQVWTRNPLTGWDDKLYGAIPPRGANIYFNRYHTAVAKKGMSNRAFFNTLKTAIPYIARVGNRKPAYGGLDDETLEAAMVRVPALLRSRERAVTRPIMSSLPIKLFPGQSAA